IDAIGRAVAALEAKEAAPDLAAHLADPSTPQPVLKELAAALVALGGGAALSALRELLYTYRAGPMFFGDPGALTIPGEGLLRLGGPAGRRAVEFVAREPRTIRPVASYLEKLLTEAPKPKY